MSANSYLGALLWSSTVGDDDRPADEFDASPELITTCEQDWERFCSLLPDDFEPEDQLLQMITEPEWDAWDYLAHDFALTRNHHGTGFWDAGRWAEPWGERLTAIAHQFPEVGLFLNTAGTVESY